MLKEQETNVIVLPVVVILIISLFAPAAKAQLDIDWIAITSCKNFVDGTPTGTHPWSFEIWLDTVTSGDLDHIYVTQPGGGAPFTMTEEDPGSWGWDSPSQYTSLAALRTDHPEGEYTLEFRNASSATFKTIALDYDSLPGEPLNPVNFTYPSGPGQTGVSTNPTLTWTIGSGDGNVQMVGLWDVLLDDDTYWDAPVPMSTNSVVWMAPFLKD